MYTQQNRAQLFTLQLLLMSVMLLILAVSLSAAETIETDKEKVIVEEVFQSEDIPWGMAFISEKELLFTEKKGRVQLLDLKTKTSTDIGGVPAVKSRGQGGLLDVAVPPDYTKGDYIYFTYSKPIEKSAVTTIARATISGNRLLDWQDLLITRSATDTNQHYGSRIAFDQNGHIFFTIGDRGVRPNGQDLYTHAGSVIRLNLDGTVPADNPFAGAKDALPEIYSYGHRNPQGLAYDVMNKRLWLIEHGPRGGDEINRIRAGANYGWPVISHGQEYWAPIPVGEAVEREGIESPAKVYIPSIAPGSLLLYSGKQFPNWRGNLLAGALKLRHINRVEIGENGIINTEERLLESLEERVRALVEGPDGSIYFSTDSGKIFRMTAVK